MSDQEIWKLGSDAISLSIKRSQDSLVISSLQVAGTELVEHPASMLSLNTEELRVQATHVDVTATTLTVSGAVPDLGVDILRVFTLAPEHGTITIDTKITNVGTESALVGDVSSMFLPLSGDDGWNATTVGGGRWNTRLPTPAYHVQDAPAYRWPISIDITVGEDGRSTTDHLPWIQVQGEQVGLIATLAWSGRWALAAHGRGGTLALELGIEGFEHQLAPGNSIDLPTAILCGYAGSAEQGADIWRNWIQLEWAPDVPSDWPWVQYNHWYAYYGDIDADRLLEEAKHAADIGCEVFVIDDGWFRNRIPTSYSQGWGDWVEDSAKFPNGLKQFGDDVRAMGMKFGLWVEPERFDHDGEIAKTHPDFIARRDGEYYRRQDLRMEGHHICLGNPKAQDWVIQEITRVVQDYGVDWLKWDYNIGYKQGCNEPDHGHQPGDGAWAHTQGLYRAIDTIRENCPDLIIENCASGGHRTDLGMLRRTHTNWASDFTHVAASCRQHQICAGRPMPLSFINTWVLDEHSQLEYRSRYGGAFGVSSHLGRWSDSQRSDFALAASEYKRLRPLLYGRRNVLTGINQGAIDATQYTSNDGATIAILSFVEGAALQGLSLAPMHLNPDATYDIERDGAGLTTRTGADIMTNGLAIAHAESDLVWLTQHS